MLFVSFLYIYKVKKPMKEEKRREEDAESRSIACMCEGIVALRRKRQRRKGEEKR